MSQPAASSEAATSSYRAHVDGRAGVPVVLLAGGASSSRGYYPGLSGLADDHRLVFFDRPGTGLATNTAPATLDGGTAALHQALSELCCSPAVIVGHSLGAVAALHAAMTHPDDVAALILLDPTPINDARIMRPARLAFAALVAAQKWPVIGPAVDRAHAAAWRRSLGSLEEEAVQCMHAMLATSSASGMASALSTIQSESADLLRILRPQPYPIVIVTADRPAGSRSRRAHERLAAQLDAELQLWPSTVHALHLQQPKRVAALIQDLAAAGRP